MGGRKFHKFRKGNQLEIVCRLRRRLQQRQQLAVDAVHRTRRGQSHLHRDQILHARLLAFPRNGAVVQGDIFTALLRV